MGVCSHSLVYSNGLVIGLQGDGTWRRGRRCHPHERTGRQCVEPRPLHAPCACLSNGIWIGHGLAVYQFIFSIILLYPSAFTENLAANQVWQNLADGAKCLVAINPTKSDHCSNAPWLVALYCVANIGYNILIIILLRVGGANLLWLVLTAIVPLGALTFTLPFIPASNRSQINWEIFVGLFVIMAGLVIYRFWDRIAGLFGMGGDKKATSAAAAGAAAGGDASGDKAEGALGLGLDEDGLTVSSQSPSFATTPIRGTNMHIPRRLQQQGGKPARAPAAPAGRRPAPAGGEAPF